MIIAGDTTNYQFMSKFPLQTFLSLPSLFQGFANDHQVSQQKYVEDGLSDHAVIHRYPIVAPPPINRLPIELLADIFFLTLRNYAGDWGMQGPPLSRNFPGLSFSPGSSSDPMILAQVCRHWRGVALTTPMLWSSMAILCTERRQHLPLLKTWLERSGDCPLTITLLEPFWQSGDKDKWWPQQHALATDLLSLLITECHRWKAINFRFSLRTPLVLANLPVGSLHNLESATILGSQVPTFVSDDLPSLDKVWGVVHASTSFRKGQWQYEYIEHRLDSIPWMQLTCINVTMSIDSLLGVLPCCNNLRDLNFTDARLIHNTVFSPALTQSSDYPVPHTLATFPLPCLRNLSIAIKQSSDIIFRHLTLPSLDTMSIREYRYLEGHHNSSSFNDLLARSECRLRRYSYEDPSPDGESVLLEVLASPLMSSITNLSVDTPVTDKFIKLLTQTPCLRGVLPRLESLFIGACTSSPGSLLDMVLSRRLGIYNHPLLRDIELSNWGYHNIDLEGFKALAEQGMFVDV